MSHIKLAALILSENIEIKDVLQLDIACKDFAKKLVDDGILIGVHKNLTSSDIAPKNYIEDIADVIRNEIIHWKNTANARGGR